MAEVWVVNASPLIVLARVGALDLLLDDGHQLIIPGGVAREVCAGPPGDAARAAIESGWGQRENDVKLLSTVLEWGIGAGESEVISLAKETSATSATAILDDAKARACARAMNVSLMGTLSVIVRAKLRGRIPSAAELLREVRQSGFRLHDSLIAKVLAEIVGEHWEG